MDKSFHQQNFLDADPGRGIDPRLVLTLAIGAMALLFAASSWWRIMLFIPLAWFLLARLELSRSFRWRFYWLRWLLVSIIALHMLLSPGHTIRGLSWFTYEGLARGLMVSLQIVLAMAISLVLMRLLTSERAVQTFAALLKPLTIIGFDVSGPIGQLRMTLRFVPVLQEEGKVAVASVKDRATPGFLNRIQILQKMVMTIFERMVVRADRLAHQAASGTPTSVETDKLPSFLPLNPASRVTVCVALAFMTFYFLLP
ncbi:MAG: hypothetical protein C0623_01305 [Desulfuromonas sp.]|nr:MAG: hypothetical protein C0623_01305 [Desulfuromonas sp.]